MAKAGYSLLQMKGNVMKNIFGVIMCVALFTGLPAFADEYDNGVFAKFLAEWGPLAENGDAKAQYYLGIFYENGQYVPQDYQQALKWFTLSAAQGNADAQFSIGLQYNYGRGVPQNYSKAVKWYKLSAEQGNSSAQYNLGAMYNSGEGVEQDRLQAVKLFRLAAEQGYIDAQYNLGVAYNNGQAVPQDYVRAHMWVNIATSRNSKKSEKYAEIRDFIAKKMTPDQIAEAQKRASECFAKNYKGC